MKKARPIAAPAAPVRPSLPAAQSARTLLSAAPSARTILIIAAAAVGLYLCYQLSVPFIPSLTWAAVLAITILPLHRRLEVRLGRPNLAASLSVALTAIVVVVPVLLVVRQIVGDAASGASHVGDLLETAHWREVLAGYPWLNDISGWIDRNLNPAGIAGSIGQWLTAQSSAVLQGSLAQALNFVLTFYLLFYFLRDRRAAMRAATELSPFSDAEAVRVVDRFVETVHATIFGTLAVAVVQGALGGLMFWWLDLPAPIFWGVVMGMLAILPFLGASIVWFPAALILAADGAWGKALILAAWGALVVATVDNLLFPVFVGNRLKLHTVVAFVGVVGGIVVFGAPGLVLGPATIAVTLALIGILKQRFEPLEPPPSAEDA